MRTWKLGLRVAVSLTVRPKGEHGSDRAYTPGTSRAARGGAANAAAAANTVPAAASTLSAAANMAAAAADMAAGMAVERAWRRLSGALRERPYGVWSRAVRSPFETRETRCRRGRRVGSISPAMDLANLCVGRTAQRRRIQAEFQKHAVGGYFW